MEEKEEVVAAVAAVAAAVAAVTGGPFGGRPGLGAHHAPATLNEVIADGKVSWVLAELRQMVMIWFYQQERQEFNMNVIALYMSAMVAMIIAGQTGEATASSNLSVLADLTIGRAGIDWKADDFEPRGLAVVDLHGVVELPDGKDFHSLDPTAVINVHIGVRLIMNSLISFSPKGDQSDLWIANESNSEERYMQIDWRSATTGEYRFRGTFDPTRFALVATEEPMMLTFVLSLGDEMLTKEASVFGRQWNRNDPNHWKMKGN